MDEEHWDVIIVGAGPAGLSAALMLGRSRRRVLVIDSNRPRNRFSAHMHGVLGLEGMPPNELRNRGRAETEQYGVEFQTGSVVRVSRCDKGLEIELDEGVRRLTRALIVATGLSDGLPDVPGLAPCWGKSVLHCPYCHGWEVRDGALGVLITSLFGVHQAELIRQLSSDITVFSAGAEKLESLLSEEARNRLASRDVKFEFSPAAEFVSDRGNLRSVRFENGNEIPLDAVFTVGIPVTHEEFLSDLGLQRQESPFGSFMAVDQFGKTSDDRIWAVGNVVNPAANVPMSVGAGSLTGGAVNAALVGWDFDGV